jgi:hypothetical protein
MVLSFARSWSAAAGRLPLLHTAVQIPCSSGANILQQYGNL